jgi:hypothetical protein
MVTDDGIRIDLKQAESKHDSSIAVIAELALTANILIMAFLNQQLPRT